MKGINCLQDLRARFTEQGIKVTASEGWYFTTRHGKWTMALGDVYLNMKVIHDMSQAEELAKLKRKIKAKKITANVIHDEEEVET